MREKITSTVVRKSRGKRIAKIILFPLLGAAAVLVIVIFALWHNELSTLLSIRQITDSDDAHRDESVYEMTVSGDYYFDDFLAQGGAANDTQLISFITSNITRGLFSMKIDESEIGCSSFTAVTEDDGHRVFGRNYDAYPTNVCIVHTSPGGGRHASVSTVDLEFLGIETDEDVDGTEDKILMLAAPYAPLDGINDAGVACGIYMSFQGGEGYSSVATDQNTDRPDLTSTTMLRMILDYADDVEEAITMVEEYDLHDSANSSFHYMIADAQGNSAVLEWVYGTDSTDNDGSRRKLKIIRPQGVPYQTVTNYILAEGYYNGEPEMAMEGLDRNNYLQERLSACEGSLTDIDEVMGLLETVGCRSWEPEDEAVTVYSVVYDLTDCSAVWVGNEHYGEKIYTRCLSVKSNSL